MNVESNIRQDYRKGHAFVFARRGTLSGVHIKPSCTQNQTSKSRVYDAENHVTTDTCNDITNNSMQNVCAPVGSGTYAWRPAGDLHTYTNSSDGITYTFHWDGDQLLYVNNGSNNLSSQC